MVISDVLLALLCWGMPLVIWSLWVGGGYGPILLGAGPSLAVWLMLRALLGLYPGYSMDQVEDLRRQTYAALAALAITFIFVYEAGYGGLLSPWVIAGGFAGILLLTPVARHFVKRALSRAGLWGKPVAVLGSRGDGMALLLVLRREWYLGLRPVLLVDDRSNPAGVEANEGIEVVSYKDSITESFGQARERGVDTAIFAMPRTRREDLAKYVDPARENFRSVIVMPNLGGITNSAVVARDFAGSFGVEIRHNLLDPWSRRAKRLLDLLSTAAGGALIGPLLLGISLLVKLDSPGPAFYGHRRIGSAGEHFRCWKFRTMYTNAEQLLEETLSRDAGLRAEWEQNFKLRDDPRVTRIGGFLRKTSLDELPQLWNVIRGEMSLVGPRPIVDDEVPRYGEVYEMYRRIKPGISGFWQVNGRSDTSYAERVKLDAYYVHNWSVWLDLVILARTAGSVLLGRGAR
jgi:Undecaprenyl-phosphate galactose phosphotransferase WbaP